MNTQKKAAAPTATQFKSLSHRAVYTDNIDLSTLNLQIGKFLLNCCFPLPADLRNYRWQQFQRHLSRLTLLKYGRAGQ